MKFLFTLLFTSFVYLQTASLETIRKEYSTAHLSKNNIESFNSLVSKSNANIPAIAGYKAAGEVIKAKFAKGTERKNSIYNGVKALETAILRNPNDVELRLIRLSVQENLPKFIKYNKNMTEDKNLIISKYASQNSGLQSQIKKFSAQSKTISASERAKLK